MRWKPRPANKGEINYHLIDRFTLAHLALGLAYGGVGFGFWTALALAAAWEAIENPLKANFAFLFPHASADTLRNMLGDVSAVLLGWSLGRQLAGV
jgi:hypothetical protein